ncbi:hypothetical protein DRQ36_04920 [bacterium]|nr:MAG: hypothetical protein DRQ36_04920 [bacterium]
MAEIIEPMKVNMDEEKVILEIDIRPLGEMIVEILQNEGIEARLVAQNFLGSAYLTDGGLAYKNGAFGIVVPSDEESRAREIIEQLKEAGELGEDS